MHTLDTYQVVSSTQRRGHLPKTKGRKREENDKSHFSFRGRQLHTDQVTILQALSSFAPLCSEKPVQHFTWCFWLSTGYTPQGFRDSRDQTMNMAWQQRLEAISLSDAQTQSLPATLLLSRHLTIVATSLAGGRVLASGVDSGGNPMF